jgi:hypothetical protein
MAKRRNHLPDQNQRSQANKLAGLVSNLQKTAQNKEAIILMLDDQR